MHCNGICSKYTAKHSPKKGGWYESGHRRCSSCEVFIIFNGKCCPCCGCILRGKPRNSKARDKIIQSVKLTKSISKT